MGYAASHILASDIYDAYLCGSSTSSSTSTSTSSGTGSTPSASACKNSATKEGMLLRSNGGMLLRQHRASHNFSGGLDRMFEVPYFPLAVALENLLQSMLPPFLFFCQ